MSIAALITGGIGPGSTIPLLLTEGLGIGKSAPVTADTHDYPLTKKELEQLRRQERKRRAAEEARALDARAIRGELERAMFPPKETAAPAQQPIVIQKQQTVIPDDDDETDIELLLLSL